MAKRKLANVLSISEDTHEAWIGDQLLKLRHREWELLILFATNPGRVLKRAFLLESVWGIDKDILYDSTTLTVHVSRLRAKLVAAGWEGDPIEVVYLYGYKFAGNCATL